MTDTSPRRGCFPGSFNPLTIAHVEIAKRARDLHRLDEVHLTVSRVALDKPDPEGPTFEERISIIEADAAHHAWLRVAVTDAQLIVDISLGYDVVIMGADKWEQVNDVRYYADDVARDDAVRRLPTVVVAERDGSVAPVEHALDLPEHLQQVSSTAARAGDRSQMAPEAQRRWG